MKVLEAYGSKDSRCVYAIAEILHDGRTEFAVSLVDHERLKDFQPFATLGEARDVIFNALALCTDRGFVFTRAGAC